MKLSPEIEVKGLKTYEQVCAFERLRSWRLPLSYGVVMLIPIVYGVSRLNWGDHRMAEANFAVAILCALGLWFHWRRLNTRHANNLKYLAELEVTYGDQLPWIQVEKHFEALKQLQRELEEED